MEDLIKEALALRKDGLFKAAYDKLSKAFQLDAENRDIKATLNAWERELCSYNWNMARKNSQRQSSDPSFGEWSSIIPDWKTRIDFKIPQGILPNIPSPITAEDVLIVPNEKMNGFIGIIVDNGEIIGSELFLPSLLSYSSTPVYLSPFLIFATSGSIFKLSISSSVLISKTIEDKRIVPVGWSSPVATEDKAIFVFKDTIFIYCDRPKFIPFKLKNEDDFLTSPVIFDKIPIFLSKYGEILSLETENIERIKEPFKDVICGSPCLFKNKIYFEGVLEGERYIFSYNLLKKELISCVIPQEICLASHIHLNFSPLVFKEGIIVSSDLGQRLYYIKDTGDKMAILPLDINLKGIHQISTIFCSLLSNVILGKSSNGFFYFDILSLKGRNEVFREKTEIISQPVIRGNRVFFLTLDGVRGFRID